MSQAITGRDRRSLPLGLRRYRPNVFEQMHGLNSGVVTGSQVSALFGLHRHIGRYALAQHISGRIPLPEVSNSLVNRGQRFQRPLLEWVAEEQGWEVDQIHAYAQCRQLPRLAASPDGLVYPPAGVAIAEVGIPAGPGPLEGKVVADFVFERSWADGPPVDVLLQHQTQLLCTGAQWGAIAAMVLGSTRCDLHVYPMLPNQRAYETILDATSTLFAFLDADQLPPPDDHQSSIAALAKAFPHTVPNRIKQLDSDEAIKRFDLWHQAGLDRRAAEGIEKAQKRWFFVQDPEAELFTIGQGREVHCKVIERRESKRIIPASSYRRWDTEVIGQSE